MRTETCKEKRGRRLRHWKEKKRALAAAPPEAAVKLQKGWRRHYSAVVRSLVGRLRFREAEEIVLRSAEFISVDLQEQLELPRAANWIDVFGDDFWDLAERQLDARVENITYEAAWRLVDDLKDRFGIDFSDKLVDIIHLKQGIRPSPKRPKPR